MITTKEGIIIATDHVRLVVGQRGAYVEILDEHIVKQEIEVQPGQAYRREAPWRDKVYYEWWRTKVGRHKLYFQLRLVTYADYKLGRWYIAPAQLVMQRWRTT